MKKAVEVPGRPCVTPLGMNECFELPQIYCRRKAENGSNVAHVLVFVMKAVDGAGGTDI